jgi:RNA-directed DNA polymerase
VKQVKNVIKTGFRFAVDVELSKFFDRVDHDLLMTFLGYKVKDKRLLKLIKRYLRAGILCNIKGITSFTWRVEKVFHKTGRYWRTSCSTLWTKSLRNEAISLRVLSSISRYLSHRLKLVVNTTKSHVFKPVKANFLDLHSTEDAFNGIRRLC